MMDGRVCSKNLGMKSLSDKELMIRVKKSDHDAFSLLVERHTNRFFKAAYRMYPNVEAAEDIVQEAFLKLWANPSMWNSGKSAKFTTWFYRVVVNLAIDYIRKNKNSKGFGALDRIIDNASSQEEVLEDKQKRALLENAICSLPERQKIALNLCFYEGLSNKDAAYIMDVKVKALESLLMRAKRSLKDILFRNGALK